jgi:hypothetical protein
LLALFFRLWYNGVTIKKRRRAKMNNIYYDDFENMAVIRKRKILPDSTAHIKYTAYTLSLYAMYGSNMLYHLSTHETIEDAENKLKTFSLGTFKKSFDGLNKK